MRRVGEAGFALLATIWATIFLAVAVGAILQIIRSDLHLTEARGFRLRNEAIADAIVNMAVLRMLDTTPDRQGVMIPTDGTPFAMEFDDHIAQVRVQDESGRIDLNHAKPEILHALLIDVGMDTDAAASVTREILDWRRAPGHVSAPFRSVAELRLVAGMTVEIYRRVAPLLTVHAHTEWIDPNIAGLDVLRVVATIDVNAGLALRHRTDLETNPAGVPSRPGVTLGRAFSIYVTVMKERGAIFNRTVIIRLTGNHEHPIIVYSWE